MPPPPDYAALGIDQADFYRRKFRTLGSADFTQEPMTFLAAGQFKFLWAWAHAPPGCRVLDFGCGSGMLGSLVRKGCHLTGVDLSVEALEIARAVNGYAETYAGDFLDFQPPRPFDRIISLDVFGHIEFAAKDAIIRKMRSLLAPGGVMLHAIECGDVDYAAMEPDALRRYVEADGHIGVETREAILARFSNHFRHVEGEVRCHDALPAALYRKHDAAYGQPLLEPVAQAYLDSLDPLHAQIFDVASGLALRAQEMHDLRLASSRGGLCMVRASDSPLPPADFRLPRADCADPLEDGGLFLRGWHAMERPENAAIQPRRWSSGESYLFFEDAAGQALQCEVVTEHPQVRRWRSRGMQIWLEDADTGETLATATLFTGQPVSLRLPVTRPRQLVRCVSDRTWSPRRLGLGEDSRTLAFAVSRVRLGQSLA